MIPVTNAPADSARCRPTPNHREAPPLPKQLILILGGARSGKSAFAERLARAAQNVLFVATAEPLDDDMARRIAAHRGARPAHWRTLEEPLNLAAAIPPALAAADIVLLDCLTLWVSNMLLKAETALDAGGAEASILASAAELLDLYETSTATWILVSNEVGLGVVPPSPLGRAYRDALGRVNALAAARADKVYLMTAGLALDLTALGARRPPDLTPDLRPDLAADLGAERE